MSRRGSAGGARLGLHYSSCNEDLDAELCGLAPARGQRLLAVTGGGGRAIGLLLLDPAEVMAVDRNPFQCWITELKRAAFLTLDHPSLLTFFGVGGTPQERLRSWPAVRLALGREAAEYWSAQREILARGVLFAGAYERRGRQVARVARLLFGRHLRSLFRAPDLDQQLRVWFRLRRLWRWRWVMRMAGRRFERRYHLDSTEWYGERAAARSVSKSLMGRFNRLLTRIPARESHVLQLRLWGRYVPGGVLPHYLRAENFNTIRRRFDRLTIVEGSLQDMLFDAARGSFDGFSLSNVTTFLTPAEIEELWRGLMRAARPGARVVLRDVLQTRKFPESVERRIDGRTICRLPELQHRMQEMDKSLVYDLAAYRLQPERG